MRQRQELDFEGQKVHVILAQSTSEPQFPEKSGVIRVKHYKQRLAIQSDGKKGSKGKKVARVGVPARARRVKTALTAGTENAGCLFPEVRGWPRVKRNKSESVHPQKLGWTSMWISSFFTDSCMV